jgi:hypothetical protein
MAITPANSISQKILFPKDITRPRTPTLLAAGFGALTDAAPPPTVTPRSRDPLFLQFGNIEQGAKLQVRNYSKDGGKEWTDLPGSTRKDLVDGQYGLQFSDPEAEKLGFKPGDVMDIRQVDAAGNVSDPVRVSLDNNGSQVQVNLADVPTDTFGMEKLSGRHTFNEYNEGDITTGGTSRGRAPWIDLSKWELASEGSSDVVDLHADAIKPGETAAVEAGATITVTSKSAEQGDSVYQTTVMDDMSFNFRNNPIQAKAGDVLDIQVTDHNGQVVELGTLTVGKSASDKA